MLYVGEITNSSAFILPQWGGVVIANQSPDTLPSRSLSAPDLDDTFSLFRKQLLTLVGVSELPSDFELVHATGGISDWQLDTLYRQRALENVESSRETLQSILKLVDQIPNMPVGQDVKGDFQSALDELELVRSKRYFTTVLGLTILHIGIRKRARVSGPCTRTLGPGPYACVSRIL